MDTDLAEKIMEYLTSRRMVSLKNLAEHFNYQVEDISPIVMQLETDQRIRVAMSRCSSDCSSCSSCGDSGNSEMSVLTETSIIISLERIAEE